MPLLGNGNVKKISLLGSTGSIGTQTCDIAEEHPDKFEIVALSAGKNLAVLSEQIKKFKPKMVSISDGADVAELKEMIKDMDGDAPRFSTARTAWSRWRATPTSTPPSPASSAARVFPHRRRHRGGQEHLPRQQGDSHRRWPRHRPPRGQARREDPPRRL